MPKLVHKPAVEKRDGASLAARDARIMELSRGGLSNVVIARRMGLTAAIVGIVVRKAKRVP